MEWFIGVVSFILVGFFVRKEILQMLSESKNDVDRLVQKLSNYFKLRKDIPAENAHDINLLTPKGPETFSLKKPVDMDLSMAFNYTGEYSEICEALDNREYGVLHKVIISTPQKDQGKNGLVFLENVKRDVFTDNLFITALRSIAGHFYDTRPLLLYRTLKKTEKRYYDYSDYDYVYHYSHILLMPDNTYAEIEAEREYSLTYQRD